MSTTPETASGAPPDRLPPRRQTNDYYAGQSTTTWTTGRGRWRVVRAP